MNFAGIFTSTSKPKITLRDLVKPELSKLEQAAIKRALKNSKKMQDSTRQKASQISA